jgi:hypothetical protein
MAELINKSQPKPVPKIFTFINQIEQISDPIELQKLQSNLALYVQQDPYSLYVIYAGMTPYSYATSTSIRCLQALHEAFLQIRGYFIKLRKILPFDVKSTNGYSPLHFAVEFNLPEQLTFLIETVGINRNQPDNNGNTPFHLACLFNREHIFQLLLYFGGVNLERINVLYETPLMTCVKYNRVNMARDLLSKGAEIKYQYPYRNITRKIDIYHQVHHIGSPAMIFMFEKFFRSRRQKMKSRQKKQSYHKKMLQFTHEYQFVCSSLEDTSNLEVLKLLATKFGVSTTGLSKNEICDKLANQIHLKHRMNR